MIDFDVIWQYLPRILDGALLTVALAILSVVLRHDHWSGVPLCVLRAIRFCHVVLLFYGGACSLTLSGC